MDLEYNITKEGIGLVIVVFLVLWEGKRGESEKEGLTVTDELLC